MTLFYDSENDLCDRHPRLCTNAVPDEMPSIIEGMELEQSDEDEHFRYECSSDVIGCELGYCEV